MQIYTNKYFDLRFQDNMELMAEFPDNYFELAIVDPPYGIGVDNMQNGNHPTRSKNDGFGSGPGVSTAVRLKKNRLNTGSGKLKSRLLNTSNTSWDIKPPPEYFNEIKRVSKNQIIWGGNYFDLPPTRCIICWNKLQPWENFSQWEMAWTSFDGPASMFTKSNTGGNNLHKRIHPTEKPVALYKWLLTKYAKPGQKILDTHLGSASIAIAVHQLNTGPEQMDLHLTGCELDEDYWNSSIERLKENTKQMTIFQ